MSERFVSDFEVLVRFTAAAITGLVSTDPDGEWTATDIAKQALDIALESQLEMKRRKSDKDKKSGDGVTGSGFAAAMPAGGTPGHPRRVPRRLEESS
jgi:hypothetical protein